jgi:hypothetical protein
MKELVVHFSSGEDVLSAYWGFLDRGGLVLSQTGLKTGQAIALEIHIRSLKTEHRILGRVVRVKRDGSTYVAFQDRSGASSLLNASFADSYDVPQRKHPRFDVDRQVGFGLGSAGTLLPAWLLDVSRGGCRLKAPLDLPVGAPVRLVTKEGERQGKVRWTTVAREVGVEFTRPDLPVEQFTV